MHWFLTLSKLIKVVKVPRKVPRKKESTAASEAKKSTMSDKAENAVGWGFENLVA